MSSNRGIKRAPTRGEKASHVDVKHVQDLPDDLFQICLDFVGPGNFAFVAPVSKHFYWQYINLDVNCTVFDADTALQQGRNKCTTTKVVGNGSLRLATECFLKAPYEFKAKVCQQAAVNGRVDILDCAVSLGISMSCIFRPFCRYGERFLIEALKNGHLNVIEFLSTKGVEFYAYYLESALQNGNAHKLQWMISKEMITLDKEKMAGYLARDGELEILKEHYQDSITDEVFRECVKGGHIDVMEWILQSYNYEIDTDLCVDALESGSIPMMKLCLGRLQNDGFPGRVCVSWILGRYRLLGTPKEKGETLNILKWLHEQNITFASSICPVLAKYGNLEALKWAREKGYGWDHWQGGYGWDKSTFRNAVFSRDIATLEYCLKNECPSPRPSDLYDSFKGCGLNDQETLAVYKCLSEYGVPWHENATYAAAYNGHLFTLKWALDHDCPWQRDILYSAFDWVNTNMAVLEYVIGHCIRKNMIVHQLRVGNQYLPSVYIHAIEVMTQWNRTDIEIIKILQLFRDYNIPHPDLDNIISFAESIGKTNVARWLRCNAF